MTKKTTLIFDESIYKKVRERAAQKGESMSSIVAEALMQYFASKPANKKKIVKLTLASGNWTAPVDPRNNRELLDYLDAYEREEKGS